MRFHTTKCTEVSEALKQVDMLERADYEPNALSGDRKCGYSKCIST